MALPSLRGLSALERSVPIIIRHLSLTPALDRRPIYIQFPEKFRTKAGKDIANLLTLEKAKRGKKTDLERGKYIIQQGDNHTRRNFGQIVTQNLALALLHPKVREDVIGRGISITKVKLEPQWNCIQVFMVSSKLEIEEETMSILEARSEDIRQILEKLCGLGHLPTLQFVKDKNFVTSAVLEEEFTKVKEDKEKYEQNTQMEGQKRLEAVLTLRKATDGLGFDRKTVLSEINRAISVAEATSDMRGKANPDESQIYVGFNDRSDNDFTLVKKYLGKRRKKYLVDLRDS